LTEHNSGLSTYTKSLFPWNLVHTENFELQEQSAEAAKDKQRKKFYMARNYWKGINIKSSSQPTDYPWSKIKPRLIGVF
jgi:hypothetical protein